MSLQRRIDRLARVFPPTAPSDALYLVFTAFLRLMSRDERRAVLDRVHGKDLTPEQIVLITSVEECWQQFGAAQLEQAAALTDGRED
jgi:hypothetical protein